MNNEPDFDEQDIEDDLMNDLPTGKEKLPLQEQQQDSFDALNDFFFNAGNGTF